MKLAPLAVAAVVLVAACGSPTRTAAGLIIAVDQRSLTDIASFTLRTQERASLTFEVGGLDLSSGGFPANHLREHMAASMAVAVAYVEEGGRLVATRLVDATWLQP